MKRKTFEVNTIKTKVNSMLADSVCSPDGRMGMLHVLETILHETGNYAGFRYLEVSEVPNGQLPGIHKDGPIYNSDREFSNTDPTRVEYL